jgi:hypothetical protein
MLFDELYKNVIMITTERGSMRSYLVLVSSEGLDRANTGFPQEEVDYDPDCRYKNVKIIGVDIV